MTSIQQWVNEAKDNTYSSIASIFGRNFFVICFNAVAKECGKYLEEGFVRHKTQFKQEQVSSG